MFILIYFRDKKYHVLEPCVKSQSSSLKLILASSFKSDLIKYASLLGISFSPIFCV